MELEISDDTVFQLQEFLVTLSTSHTVIDLYHLVLNLHSKVTGMFERWTQSIIELLSKRTNKLDVVQKICKSLQENLTCLIKILEKYKSFPQTSTCKGYLSSLCLILCCCFQVLSFVLNLCKEIETNYGYAFESLANQLSLTFKTAFTLLKVATELADIIKPTQLLNGNELDLMIKVLTPLLKVAQDTIHFDPSLILLAWKALGKLVCRLKDHTHQLDDTAWSIQDIVKGMCDAMKTKSRECLLCAPLEEKKIQDSNSSFTKLLKTCRFFATLLVKLVQDYENYHYELAECVLDFLLELINSMAIRIIPRQSLMQLETNILVVSEPLLSCLMNCEVFLNHLTSSDKTSQYPYSWCWLLCILFKFFTKLEDRTKIYLLEPLSAHKDGPVSCRILNAIFSCAKSCYCEFSLPVKLPGIMCNGQPQIEVTLYEYFCVHVCALVGNISAEHFHILENVLLQYLCCDDFYCSLLTIDIWCFISRWGSSDLCLSHVHLLTDLVLNLQFTSSLGHLNIQLLLRRLVAFLTTQQQREFVQKYTPSPGILKLWSTLSVASFDISLLPEICELLFKCCIQLLQESTTSQHNSVINITYSLQSLRELLNQPQCKPHLPILPHYFLNSLMKLFVTCIQFYKESSSHHHSYYVNVTYQLLEVIAAIIDHMNDDQILLILAGIYYLINENTPTCIMIGVTSVLSCCGTLQNPIFKEHLCTCFLTLLSSHHSWLTKHMSLDAFRQFAEVTPFSETLERCVPASLSESVVSFIQRVPLCKQPELLETTHIIKLIRIHQESLMIKPLVIIKELEEEGDVTEENNKESVTLETLLVNFQESWKQLKSCSPLTRSVITDLKNIWEDIGQIIDRK